MLRKFDSGVMLIQTSPTYSDEDFLVLNRMILKYLISVKLSIRILPINGCYRSITWLSYIIQKQKDPSRANRVQLEIIVKALQWLEMDMDVDEVEVAGWMDIRT